MSIVVKAGTGLFAGVVAGLLGLAFLPQVAPNAVKPRRAVEAPKFVETKPAAAPQAVTTAAVVVAKETTPAIPKPTPAVETNPATPKVVVATAVAPPKPAAAVAPTPVSPPAAPAPVAAAPATPAPMAAASAPVMAAKVEPAPAPPTAAVSAPTKPAAVSEDAARWSARGLTALAKGDMSTARLFLARAAEAGDARAWVALADTYDPAILSKLGVIGALSDVKRAKAYLAKAVEAGIVVPKDRIAALDQVAPDPAQ